MNAIAGTASERAPWSRGRLVAVSLLGVLLLLVILAGVRWRSIPVSGGLRMGAEPGVEIYVGHRLVGVGQAEVAWSDIFGWTGTEPLGIVLPPDARPVPSVNDPFCPSDAGWPGEATAERLAGEGATIVSVSAGNPPRFSYAERNKYERKELLLRRRDGTLDQVFCLDVELAGALGNRYRALVPIRPRAPENQAASYVGSCSSGRWEPDGRRFDNGYARMVVCWGFELLHTPRESVATN
ncbi:MAG: hypothetical protein KJZ87_28320 [Thermoguttaceae bacterium]|nr:hypothetical protein [Thermoguttaceae bacterium]